MTTAVLAQWLNNTGVAYTTLGIIFTAVFGAALKKAWATASERNMIELRKQEAQKQILEEQKIELVNEISQLTKERMDALASKLDACEKLLASQSIRIKLLEDENAHLKDGAALQDRKLLLQDKRIRVLESELEKHNIPIPEVLI